MDDDDQIAAAAFIVMTTLIKKKERRRRRRRWWQTRFFCNRPNNLLTDLESENRYDQFRNFTRMAKADFEHLLSMVEPKIARKDTPFRKAISARVRLALTLRFLATGDSYSSLQYLFRVSKSLISWIIPEVCHAIIQVLGDYIKVSCRFDFFIFYFKIEMWEYKSKIRNKNYINIIVVLGI